MEPSILLTMIFSAWSVITAVLAILLIYRATLSSREDDQIFIDASEHLHADEQQQLVARMTRLRTPIIALTTISAILFLSGVGMWIYQGWNNL